LDAVRNSVFVVVVEWSSRAASRSFGRQLTALEMKKGGPSRSRLYFATLALGWGTGQIIKALSKHDALF
jgi:hypothetical protein